MTTTATSEKTDPWAERLTEWQAEAVGLDGEVKALPAVEDEDMNQQVGALLTLTKSRFKEVDETRSEAVGPLNREVKRVNDAFRVTLTALKSVEERLKGLMGAWILRQRQEQQRLLMEAQAAAEAQRVTDPDLADTRTALGLVEAARLAAPGRVEGVSGRDVWRVEVTDPDLVPREYCSPDLAKLKAAVDAGARTIPGVKVTAEVRVVARAS